MEEINFKKVTLIIIAGLVFGIVYNSISKNSLPYHIERLELSFDETNADGSVNTVSGIRLEQALRLFKTGVTFIDARDNWDFSDGHIKSAINIPEYKYDVNSEVVQSMDKSDTYIIYCGGDDCDVSKRLAGYLKEAGFSDLRVFVGGYDEWTKENLPVEQGEIK